MYTVRCDAPYIPPQMFHLYLLGLLPFTAAWQSQYESYNLPNNSQDNVTLLQAVYGAENTTFSPAPPWVPWQTVISGLPAFCQLVLQVKTNETSGNFASTNV